MHHDTEGRRSVCVTQQCVCVCVIHAAASSDTAQHVIEVVHSEPFEKNVLVIHGFLKKNPICPLNNLNHSWAVR